MRSKHLFTGVGVAGIAFLLVTNPVVSDAAAQITGKDIKNSSVTGKDVKDSSLGSADFATGQLPAGAPGPKGDKGDKGDKGESATALWAVINQDGTVARQHGGAAGTFREDIGTYDVFFNRDVSNCAYVASLGGADAGTPPDGSVGVTNVVDLNNALYIKVRNSAGNNANLPFHVAVFC
jgi:hypothetical protein